MNSLLVAVAKRPTFFAALAAATPEVAACADL